MENQNTDVPDAYEHDDVTALESSGSFYDENKTEETSSHIATKVGGILSKNKKHEIDFDSPGFMFLTLNKNEICSRFSMRSNGEQHSTIDFIKAMMGSFADVLEKGKSTQEMREKAQLIIDIFRGKEVLPRPAKFVEVDLKEMEKDIVKMETYFKRKEGEQNYALAA